MFEKRINMVAIILGSIIIDVRATYCLFVGCRPLHGPFHTFIGATLLGLLVIIVIYKERDAFERITSYFRLDQDYSRVSIVSGTIIGVWSHVLLDSFLYNDIIPLWPLTANPFYGMLSSGEVYFICTVSFALGIAVYLHRSIR
ncbi:MAG: metal-dependent hydrolase [Methanosarcinaceae archaeon]